MGRDPPAEVAQALLAQLSGLMPLFVLGHRPAQAGPAPAPAVFLPVARAAPKVRRRICWPRCWGIGGNQASAHRRPCIGRLRVCDVVCRAALSLVQPEKADDGSNAYVHHEVKHTRNSSWRLPVPMRCLQLRSSTAGVKTMGRCRAAPGRRHWRPRSRCSYTGGSRHAESWSGRSAT